MLPQQERKTDVQMRNNHMFISMFPNIAGNSTFESKTQSPPSSLMPSQARNAVHSPYPAQSKTPPQSERLHLQRSPLKTASHTHQSSKHSHPRIVPKKFLIISAKAASLNDLWFFLFESPSINFS